MITTENMRKRCEVLLIALMGTSSSLLWWNSPNKAFEFRTPEQVWLNDPTSVYEYLMWHASGSYS